MERIRVSKVRMVAVIAARCLVAAAAVVGITAIYIWCATR